MKDLLDAVLGSSRNGQEELEVLDKHLLEDALISLGNIIGLNRGSTHFAFTNRTGVTFVPTQGLVPTS